MAPQPILKRDVTKQRLIAALLAELDASWAMVVAECKQSRTVFSGNLQCEFRVPFEATKVQFSLPDPQTRELDCECCFGGQRISFTLMRDAGDTWHLPERITLEDFRSARRLSFSSRAYSAELIARRGSIYGYAVDVNRDYLAVDIDFAHSLAVGDSVRVIIRMVNTNCDVFYHKCIVSQIKSHGDSRCRMVLRLDRQNAGDKEHRRHDRRLVNDTSISVESSEVTDGATPFSLSITNVSFGGMTVKLLHSPRGLHVVAGLVVKSRDPDLSYLVAWAREKSAGLRPLLSSSNELSQWCRFIDRVAPLSDERSKTTRKELASLLTQSGLLKGKRRAVFGRELDAHVISDVTSDSPLLTQRRVVTNESGDPIIHITMKRYSDSAWMVADGASFSDQKGRFVEMVNACVITTRSMMDLTLQLPRYLTFIWHEAVKSSEEFARALADQAPCTILTSLQISISAVESSPSTEDMRARSFSKEPAHVRRSVSLQFTADAFEVIAANDGSHPILNGELSKLGPYHRAETKWVDLGLGKAILAHRVVTHSIWSTTGVTNSVFVLCPSNIELKPLLSALRTLAKDEIAYGSDDFLLIFDGALPPLFEKILPSPRRFSFLIHDLLQNEALKHRDLRSAASKRST